MIDAGLPLVQCLDILGTQEDDKNFAAVILQTRDRRRGRRVARRRDAKHPKTFDPLFTNMVAAGEAGGILDTILKRLATYIEKAVKLNGQVKSAMIYPIAVIVIAARRGRRHSLEGHPDLRGAVRRAGRRTAAADAHRHRAQQRPGVATPVHGRSARRCRLRVHAATTRPRAAGASIDGTMLKTADPREHPPEDRGRAVLPHAVDAHQLRRADSRRPGNHREDLRQRGHRGRDHGDAQEHRARRNDCRAAEGDRRVSRRWWCR